MASSGGISTPDCKLMVREPGGVSLLREQLTPESAQILPVPPLDKLSCTFARGSPDGSLLAVVSPADVALLDTSTGAEVTRFAAPRVTAVAFSPKGSFLLTFQKPDGQTRNLVLWNARGGSPVWEQFQKSFSKTDWPTLQFSDDEALAYRTVSGEVQFYSAETLAKGGPPSGRLKAQGLTSAQVSPSPASHVAAFFPSLKGAPASVRVYATAGLTTNSSGGAAVTEPPALARRSFFKASTVRMLWGGGARGVLVWAHSDVDKTNQSYYGDSALHFLAPDGSFEGSVPLGKEGPIHDVQWSPSGKEFVVVHGYMPAKAILFDAKCKALFDFGSGPRNMVRWSPHDHFLLLAGFGNLPGDVEFWDREKLKLLGSNKAACGVTAEWAPHGRTVAIATTSPRLQVDNGIKIFKHNGALLLHTPYKTLYEAEWLPAPKDLFPDRPPSPARGGAPNGAGAGAAGGPATKAPGYRPPNASASAGAAFRARLSGEADKPKVPGAAASSEPGKLSKSAAKNLKKKQNRAAAAAGAETESPAEGGDAKESEGERSNLTASTAALAISDEPKPSSDSAQDKDKRIRNLMKKLRQLEELKSKDKSKLTREQLEKLGQEDSIRLELKALQS